MMSVRAQLRRKIINKQNNQQNIGNNLPLVSFSSSIKPLSQSQKNKLNLISQLKCNPTENEQTASARKRTHDQVVKVSCNNGYTGAQGSSDDNKKAKYDNTHSAYPESTGLAAEALPVCSPDNQEQSETSAIVLGKVTISLKEVQTIIEFNKNGVPSDIITKFVGYSEEIVDQIISEHEKTADIRKRQHDQTVNTNCNNRDTGAQGSSDDNKKAKYDNTHSAYPESTGLAAEALPVCSPDNQEQSETSAIVLGKVTISPKDVQSIIEFNKNGVTSDIITKFVGYSEEIVDQIISEVILGKVTISPKDVQYIIESNKKGFPSHVIAHILDCSEETVDQIICEQDNNEMKEPINPDKEFLVKVMKRVNRRSLRSIVEDINKKISCEEINKKSKLGMNTLHAIKGWFYQKEICTMYHENEEKPEDIAEKFDISENNVHRIIAMVYGNNESREDCIKIRRTVISKKIVKTLEEDIKNGMCVNAIARKNRLHSSVIKKVKLEYMKPKIYAMIKSAKMSLRKIAKKYDLTNSTMINIKKEYDRENALELNKTMAQKAI